MYHASAASLRSSDASRQVGAAIATDAGDVIAVGANEAPVRGGRTLLVPSKVADARDQALRRVHSSDRAEQIKVGVLTEMLERMKEERWFTDEIADGNSSERAQKLLPLLKGTQFMNLGEFGRTVHAEMAALIDAARRGVSVDQQSLFVTTFPCHNCAKHVIASGIRRVIYLEPYPKSRAGFLHKEEVEIDPKNDQSYQDKLVFWRFSGVAPRQYHRLFRMAERGGKGDLINKWYGSRRKLLPPYVVRNAAQAYMAAEREELQRLKETEFRWDKSKLCPAT